ncbi:MAG: hypothetical protein A3J38_08890 [Gammaproteobacteria bacterium RIFCSPHIGHO2_12_FULL_45_9]|nr:MAG: hypothetical protein A3J38_08890 [Gammaproteobacteria bacterium RIFCSPHIGHO2_12_FULL_45_9]
MNNGGGQGQGDMSSNFFWLLVLMCGVGIGVWFFARAYIVWPVFAIRFVELWCFRYLADAWNLIAGLFKLPVWHANEYVNALQFIRTADPRTVSVAELSDLTSIAQQAGRFVAVCLLPVLGVILFKSHRSAKFAQTYDMNALRKTEVNNWPQISPILSLDLVKQDLDEGPWAMAQTPFDFCKKNNLLSLIVQSDKKVYSTDQGRAERLFILQMGPVLTSIRSFPIHVQALFVIFMSRATRDRKDAEKILIQISRSAVNGKLDFSGVVELLPKYENHAYVRWINKRHAYLLTFMATLLEMARSDGVLASAEFLWLKPVDRRLWFMLNAVGRQTGAVEVAGPFAHWVAERKLQRALRVPMVGQATRALEEAMNQTLYVEDRGAA